MTVSKYYFYTEGYFGSEPNWTSKYSCTDSKDRARYCAKHPQLHQQYQLLSTPEISYTHNSCGHRNDYELSDISCGTYGLALGCSHTYGTSLAKQHVYHSVFSEHVGFPIYNLGISGGNNDISLTNLIWALQNSHTKPKLIIYQQTGNNRACVIEKSETDSVKGHSVQRLGPSWIDDQKFLKYVYYSDALGIADTRTQMTLNNIRQLSKDSVFLTFDGFDQKYIYSNKARDGIHYNKDAHKLMADHLRTQYQTYTRADNGG